MTNHLSNVHLATPGTASVLDVVMAVAGGLLLGLLVGLAVSALVGLLSRTVLSARRIVVVCTPDDQQSRERGRSRAAAIGDGNE